MSRNTMSEASRQGIALVSVLAVTVVTVILAAIFSYMVISERRSTGAATASSSSLQLADAASERARAIIVDEYKKSFLSSDKFVERLGDPTDELAIKLGNTGPVSVNISDSVTQWRYAVPSDAPDLDSNPGGTTRTAAKWLDIYASAETGQGVQTVIRRITMGESDIFTLAMLSENTDCMYCHLQVFGDVGSLGYFRPGHQGVGSAGAGGGSKVNGDLFVAPAPDEEGNNITTDDTNLNGASKTINGGTFDGEVFENYVGSRFPQNDEGNPEFPPVKRNLAANSADGSISGEGEAVIQLIAEDGNVTTAPTGSSTLAANNTGNAVLIGTKTNPIKLNGDVYFSGDVVIKGYVEGKGGIYAGRNVYVAGDIKYKEEPVDCRALLVGPNGEPNEDADPDQCAQDSIGDESDELRVAARGNIVLGDYTETEGSPASDITGKGPSEKSYQALNAADYFREQFGFERGGTNTYRYDETNGDELKEVDGVFENADGDPVDVANVSDPISAENAYDYSMRPGRVTQNGFDSWLSDAAYQEILGKQKRAFDTWRKDVSREELRRIYNDAGTDAQGIAAIRRLLGPGAIKAPDAEEERVSDASIRELACADGNPCDVNASFDLRNDADELVGQVNWGFNGEGEPNVRVILDEAALYETQVNRVDAFLYSNQRIAGKTFNAPLAVNGGLVSKQLGVLAPGVEKQGWQNSRYDFLSQTGVNECKTLADTSISYRLRGGDKEEGIAALDAEGYYDLGLTTEAGTATKGYSEDCAFTVNYDYRMRNGGLGFNLVAQDVGRTVSWRVGATSEDRVQAP